jgi:2-polyprenyl-3-methyl-5-hydroxy-6-metoxy-1,4-benzoquinol methylase
MITRDYIEQDNIKIFDPNISKNHLDYNALGLDNLYAQEERHFWFITRKEFIFKNIQKYVNKSKKIIEIGAGTGNVSRYLKINGYKDISVGEMHLNGLRYAKSYGISECYQFNLLDSPFKDEFDVICLFDVLEHIENDGLALQNACKSLKNSGYLVLTVPAHMWLWNRSDVVAGHKVRYTKKQLIKKLKANNFDILRARYFFMSIVPLLFLRTILKRDLGRQIKREEYKQNVSINPIINTILLFISRLENKINPYLVNFFGGSLLVIAKKK